jgi:hypothetical protein
MPNTPADRELRDYAIEVTKALTGLTKGGSEFFSRKKWGFFTADIAACVKRVDDRTFDALRGRTDALIKARDAEARAETAETNRDRATRACEEISEGLAALKAENARLKRGLEAVLNFYSVTHCHAAAQASLAGMDAIEHEPGQ